MMMSEYASMLDGHLGRIKIAKQRYQLSKETVRVHSHFYRAKPRKRQLRRDEVYKLLKYNVAKAATTERTFSVVFAPETDGNLRFRVGYHKLCAVTVGYSYPIPRMDKLSRQSETANLLSAFDANSGQRLFELDQNDIDKPLFVTHK